MIKKSKKNNLKLTTEITLVGRENVISTCIHLARKRVTTIMAGKYQSFAQA